MNRVPKRAQRAIDAANRARAARNTAVVAQLAGPLPVPRRLEVGKTPQSILPMFEVYFDGVRQYLCRVADMDTGTIVRWTYGTGAKPGKGAVLETLRGVVEIRRKA